MQLPSICATHLCSMFSGRWEQQFVTTLITTVATPVQCVRPVLCGQRGATTRTPPTTRLNSREPQVGGYREGLGRGVALLRVSLAIAFRWAWIQANPVQSAIEYAPSRAPRRPRLAPGSPERPGGSCGSSWSAGRRPARLRWWSRWSSSSAQEGHAEVVQVLLEGHATVNQASRNDGNLRIGEAKPLGMATKQHLIHPNPDRHAPSLAAVQTDSACSSSEDDGTPTRSVKLASLEPMATRKSPTTTVADDV